MTKSNNHVINSSTLFLKIVVLFVSFAVLAGCVFLLPAGISSDNAGFYRPLLIAMYVPAIPFFIAIYQTLKLLRFIDQNTVFSPQSVTALRYIKYCGLAIGGMYTIALPYVYIVAESDDAPGVLLIGLVFAFAPMVVALFAANMQKLFQSAIHLKTENDLTV